MSISYLRIRKHPKIFARLLGVKLHEFEVGVLHGKVRIFSQGISSPLATKLTEDELIVELRSGSAL